MKYLPINDARVQSVPANDFPTQRSFRMTDHRWMQVKTEAANTDKAGQDVIDTALKEYFERRYTTKL